MAVEEDIEIDLGLERKKRMVVEEERRVLGLHLNEPTFLRKEESLLIYQTLCGIPSQVQMK